MTKETEKDNANLTLKVPRQALQLMSDKLPPGVVLLLVPPDAVAPEFVRLPDIGEDQRCPVTGMSRTWVIERIKASQGTPQKIRTHHIREKGRARGTVLVDRRSLVEFVESFPPPKWALEKQGAAAADDAPAGGEES